MRSHRHRRSLGWLGIVLVCLAGSGVEGCTSHQPIVEDQASVAVDSMMSRHLSPGTIRRLTDLSDATTVTAYRIDGSLHSELANEAEVELRQGYPVLAGPTVVPLELREDLARLLLDDDTYEHEHVNKCEIRPTVLIEYQGPSSKYAGPGWSYSSLAFDLGCKLVAFRPGGEFQFTIARMELFQSTIERLFPT